jgi:hypothetical protein
MGSKMTLALTDKQAHQLINLAKIVIKKCKIDPEISPVGKISIGSKNNKYKFNLDYTYKLNDIHLNFRDAKTNLTLVRINLDSKFHRNANNEKIEGNRVELFSTEEYDQKGDGFTQCKAYKLPYKNFNDTHNFGDALDNLLSYANVEKNNKIDLILEFENE